MKEIIRSFGGRALGSVETDSSGNVLVRSFGGKIVAKYIKADNTTRNFPANEIVAYGNVACGFLLKDVIK